MRINATISEVRSYMEAICRESPTVYWSRAVMSKGSAEADEQAKVLGRLFASSEEGNGEEEGFEPLGGQREGGEGGVFGGDVGGVVFGVFCGEGRGTGEGREGAGLVRCSEWRGGGWCRMGAFRDGWNSLTKGWESSRAGPQVRIIPKAPTNPSLARTIPSAA